MMRKLFVVAVLILCFSVFGVAQELPQFEIFGGWSYVRPDGGGNDMSPTNGWNASVNIIVNDYFSVEIEGGGHYTGYMDADNSDGTTEMNANARAHHLAFGPRFTLRQNEKFQPFYHGLFGVNHSSSDDFVGIDDDNEEGLPNLARWNSDVYDNFVMIFGGGLDMVVTDKISVRIFQADYFIERAFGELNPDLRFGTGVVVKFGEK